MLSWWNNQQCQGNQTHRFRYHLPFSSAWGNSRQLCELSLWKYDSRLRVKPQRRSSMRLKGAELHFPHVQKWNNFRSRRYFFFQLKTYFQAIFTLKPSLCFYERLQQCQQKWLMPNIYQLHLAWDMLYLLRLSKQREAQHWKLQRCSKVPAS